MNVTSTELQNNFKVIFAQDNTNPLICLQLYVRVGSAWENSDEAGFSHFTEHLVFKSTKKFPENSIMERVTFLGGSINAYTEYDTTCFYITLPSSFQKEGLEILSELALHADYNEYEFTQEKKVVIEEMKQFQNDPEDYFIEEIAEKYFKKNPYKYPIIGNLKNLQSATRKDLKNFYAKYYSPNNCFLVVSGDFDEEDILCIKKFCYCAVSGIWGHNDHYTNLFKLRRYPIGLYHSLDIFKLEISGLKKYLFLN